jgi:hypothetical protein
MIAQTVTTSAQNVAIEAPQCVTGAPKIRIDHHKFRFFMEIAKNLGLLARFAFKLNANIEH